MRTDQSIINRYTVTAGALSYSVTFPLYEQGDVAVYMNRGAGEEDLLLKLDADYSLSINGDLTGGTVTLKPGVAQVGNALALVSNVPYTQELDLSNVATLDVETIEKQLDRTTQQIQQVAEQVSRAVQAPSTIPGGGKVYYERIVAATARAEAAASSAQLTLRQVQAEKIKVEQAGDAQVDRVAGMGDMAGLSKGVACGEQTWTLSADVAVGGRIELPNELGYIPGRHHLLMSYDGVTMSQTWFEEVPAAGDPYGVSHSIITKMPFRAGQELHAWVSPLGLADVPELVERVAELEAVLHTSGVKDLVSRISTLEDALADLSRRVVYSEPEN